VPPIAKGIVRAKQTKSDLETAPIYHHERESIEAHLTIVFAALGVSRWIEARTG
jgi:hypothetical protein